MRWAIGHSFLPPTVAGLQSLVLGSQPGEVAAAERGGPSRGRRRAPLPVRLERGPPLLPRSAAQAPGYDALRDR